MNILCPDGKKNDATLALLEAALGKHNMAGAVIYGFKLCAPFFLKCRHYAVCYDMGKKEIKLLSVDKKDSQSDIVCLNRQTIAHVRRTVCGGWKIRMKNIRKPLRILVPCHTCRESKFSGVLYAYQIKQAADFRLLMENFI